MTLHAVGVRHHSPACARLVARTIERVRPRFVLVEGPSDMNGRLGELALGHELPVAVFTYCTEGGKSFASWTPFCEYSPEWVALETARRVGAEARFIDLPAWHPAFSEVANRYADRHARRSSRLQGLCERLGIEDTDALWDHLFEQGDDGSRAFPTFFDEMRKDEPPGKRDEEREAYMARCVAWALAQGGDTVLVCGGYHAPFLETAAPSMTSEWPEVPRPPEGSRSGSYLVPYSFHRLDSFVGYESGMPSPGYYQEVWAEGPALASEKLLARTAERLRKRNQPVSVADLIAAWSAAQGLKALRGHQVVTRCDVLDGIASALVKEALEAPLPWSRRGVLRARTDPLLVEVVAAFSGERTGKLAPGTPRPPLVEDALAEIAAHGLAPERRPRTVTISLVDELARSRVLHRLRVLAVPGFVRETGPEWATEGGIEETWTISERLETEAALIEASSYGATLEGAAAARLEEALLAAGGRLRVLAALLGEAAFTGIGSLAARVLELVARCVGAEPSLAELGAALARILALHGHDALLGAAGSKELALVIRAAFERGLWLVEGLQGTRADEEEVEAFLALRDSLRVSALGLDQARALAVMDRCAADRSVAPPLRGAALGFLWSAGTDPMEERAIQALRGAAQPHVLGDFLAGLFALAREQVLEAPGLVRALDEVLGGLDRRAFLVALPALRLAFSWFPPSEKERLARSVLALHGGDPLRARSYLELAVDPEEVARGLALDEATTERARRFGLHD
ncbi:MAG TPA: DUF5682 family protein [Planctomycetota bacterium]|nr:DUF5682 family protein [Planctomycetota bacterium]